MIQIKGEDEEIERITSALKDQERYKTVKKKKYTMQYRKEANKSLTLKFEGEMEIDVGNLFTLLYETEVYHLWFPNCKRASLLHSFSPTMRMIRSLAATPGLMADRESIMQSLLADRLKSKGCLYVLARSVHHLKEVEGVEVPPLSKGKVGLDVNFFCFEVEIVSRTKQIVRGVFNFDPHVRYVP